MNIMEMDLSTMRLVKANGCWYFIVDGKILFMLPRIPH